MAVTIKDVAALARVSPSTVSRVCNDNPSISKETADRVRRAMAQIGYEPSVNASAQPDNGLRYVCVVYPPSKSANYENAFYTEAIRGISQFCNPRGVGISLVSSNNTEEALRMIKAQVAGGRTDGFIMLYSKQDDPIVDYFCEEGILFVVVGTPGQMLNQTINIDNDNLSAARDATDYLYSLGHRNIGYLSTDTSYHFAMERKAGYQLSMLQHELPIRLEYCAEVRDFFSEGVQQLQAMLQRPDRPTAILVGDDVLALVLETGDGTVLRCPIGTQGDMIRIDGYFFDYGPGRVERDGESHFRNAILEMVRYFGLEDWPPALREYCIAKGIEPPRHSLKVIVGEELHD